MPKSINKVFLGGHVAATPSTMTFGNGGQMAKFSLAVNDSYKPKDAAEWVERTYWANCSSNFPHIIKACEKIEKGDYIYIEGKFTTNEGTDKSTGESKTFIEFKVDNLINHGKKSKENALTTAVNSLSNHLDDSFDTSQF